MLCVQCEAANKICGDIKAFNTSNTPSHEEDARLKPDVTFYKADTSDSKGHLKPFQTMEMFVEFKHDKQSDPFCKESQPFEKLFDKDCATCGQIILYSTRMQNYQFRTRAFSVGIFGNVARLFCWDCAGVVVLGPIRYSTRGNRDLADFFRRFNLMDRAQRGWDPTVFDATPEEATSFNKAIKAVVGDGKNSLLKSLLESVGRKDHYPRKRIEIDDGHGRTVSYIVGRSTGGAGSPTGRTTRGFVALSKDTNKLVFLKDSWRADIDGMMGEAHWFERLKGVRNLSAFLQGLEVGHVVVKRQNTSGTKNPPPDSLQRMVTNLYSERYSEFRELMGYCQGCA